MEVEKILVEPTLTAIIIALIVLAAAAVTAHSRSRSDLHTANVRTMALERGLGAKEIHQLEHLSRLIPHSSMVDLLVSPQRFNLAAARYVDMVKAAGATDAQYFGHILELTRLRRRVHPPKNILRYLDTTREMPEGVAVTIACNGTISQGVIWSVNEDHIDIRMDSNALVTASTQLCCRMSGVLGTQYQFVSTLRSVVDSHRFIVRIEHAEQLQMTAHGANARSTSKSHDNIQSSSVRQQLMV